MSLANFGALIGTDPPLKIDAPSGRRTLSSKQRRYGGHLMPRYESVREIPLERLVISSQQARVRNVEKDLVELVENIKINGQLEPIIVAPTRENPEKYEIIAGQRRFLAFQQLGHESILAAVLGAENLTPESAKAISISENLIRRDLDSSDLIDACTSLHQKYGSIKAVAEELGLPYNKVRAYVKFDRLRPRLKELVEEGKLGIRTAIRLEDHWGEDQVSDQEVDDLGAAISGMTQAQQRDYLKQVPTSGCTKAEPDEFPGSVHQIIVTLKASDFASLRAWATEQSLTQDRAAAFIVSAFFRSLKRRSERGGSTIA